MSDYREHKYRGPPAGSFDSRGVRTKVSVAFGQELITKLAVRAKKQDVSFTEMVRRLCAEALENI